MRSVNEIRIVHVIHHLKMGGMENGLINIINRTSSPLLKHTVLCIEDFSEFRQRIEDPAIPVIALGRSQIGINRVRRKLFQLLREIRPNIVHSRGLSGLDAMVPALLAGVRFRIHGEHGWDVHDLGGENRKLRLLRRLHSPLISHYVTVSKDIESYLVKKVRIAPTRITQIYNGVDTRKFAPRPNELRNHLPQEFRDPNIFVVGSVGRLQAVKDHACLIQAFALLRQTSSIERDTRLAIIGDGPERQALTALVKSLDLERFVWFSGESNVIPALMRELDVFVLPSKSEGISNTILEAFASGLPVIATAVGGNVELVEDNCCGWLVPASQPSAIAAKLGNYLSKTSVRNEHGLAARALACDRFSLEAMTQGYAKMYGHVTGLNLEAA
jgi:sugar transferase (PEP-CTERM/EpsH1 system associated)